MKTLYIIRGVPGSGKSTYAKTLGVLHYESDMYFEKDGEYAFDRELLPQAHSWCFRKVREAMDEGIDVAVSNTFTQRWEMQRFIESAQNRGYRVVVVECAYQFQNLHNVPDEHVDRMRRRWQEIPEDWDVELVKVP